MQQQPVHGWQSLTSPNSFQASRAGEVLPAALHPFAPRAFTVTTSATGHVFLLLGTSVAGVKVELRGQSEQSNLLLYPNVVVSDAFTGYFEPSSGEKIETLNRQTCRSIIAQIETASASTTWGVLTERLVALLDASYDVDEQTNPMNSASLATLLALVSAAPDLQRPRVGLNRSGQIWLEWILPARERFGIACLAETELQFAWTKIDSGKRDRFASQYGKMSVAHFVSAEGARQLPVSNTLRTRR
jgi:hypothetical protein